MDSYIVIASYTDACVGRDVLTNESKPEIVDHFTKVLGRTNDPGEMCSLAREAFKQAIEEDYKCLEELGEPPGELYEHHKESFRTVLNHKEEIKDMLDMSTDQGGEVERSAIIGSLYNHNEKHNYIQHILVTAFKEEGRS